MRKNPLSLVFEDMMYRGRGHNLLSLGELRKLLQKCQGKDDVKYGVQMMEFYQRKGQDFSEEVTSHFVSMSIRGEQPLVAVKAVAKYKNRIGAWVTPKSFHNLVTSVLSMAPVEKAGAEGEGATEEPLKLLVSALETVSKKGVKLGAEDVQEVARRLSEAGDLEAYLKVMAAAPRVIDAEAVARIAALHPPPSAPVDAAAAADAADAAPADADADAPAAADEAVPPPAV